MIVDKLGELEKYYGQIPHLEAAMAYIQAHQDLPEGVQTFNGGTVVKQTGTTKPADDGLFEVHMKYLDVQILLKGKEYILWNALSEMEEAIPYDSVKDVRRLSGEGALLEMHPGMCCILYPWDAHKGCRHPVGAQATEYEKLVIKLEV